MKAEGEWWQVGVAHHPEDAEYADGQAWMLTREAAEWVIQKLTEAFGPSDASVIVPVQAVLDAAEDEAVVVPGEGQ